jgi:hypothetical protein
MVRTHTFTAATDSEVATDGGEDADSETGAVATRTPHLTVVPENA